jgi:hypothetical protein
MVLIIKWYIILLALSYTYTYIFRRKQLNNSALCGLFGFNGNPGVMNETMARLVANKIKILGLYNIDRGKHSCGLYINNRIMKGVNDEKLFSDFIAKFLIPNAMQTGNFNVIGHTRAATMGSHSVENAHPFVIDENFVLAHNGKIENIWPLCNKYGVSHTGVTVDSHGLAHLIHKVGFKVLEQYKGWAALLMAYRDRPNSMLIYKGASKNTQHGEPSVERPLFYLQTREGIYLSSIEKSLFAISDLDTDVIGEVPQNLVIRLENGAIGDEKLYIERGDCNVTWTNPNANGTTRGGSPANTSTRTHTTTPTTTQAAGTNSSVGYSYGSRTPDMGKTIPMIWWETLPQRAGRYRFATGVIFHQGRFWLVDHDAITPMHGPYYINSKGKVDLKRNQGFNYWFIEGVMMKDKIAYETAKVDPNLAHPGWNFAMFISKYSEYPVGHTRSDVNTKCKEVPPYAKYRWYYNENMCTNFGFTPKFSDRHYIIRDGMMDKIKNIIGQVAENEEMVDTQALINERKSLFQTSPLALAHSNLTNTSKNVVEDAIQETIEDMKKAFEKKERIQTVNNELPFDMEVVPNSPLKGIVDLDPKNFYRKFSTIDEAEGIFTKEEERAIRYYITDIINASSIAQIDNVYDGTVDVYLNLFFAECIENDITVMDNWNDKEYRDVLTYLLIAKENPDGNMYDEDEIHDDSDGINDEYDACCAYSEVEIPGPIMMAPNVNLTPVDSCNCDCEVPEEWRSEQEGIVADPKDDEEPTAIDLGIERDKKLWVRSMSGNPEAEEFPNDVIEVEAEEVPSDEGTWKPVPDISDALNALDEDDREERNYTFGEGVNCLFKAREEADDLQAIENDDFAQEAALIIYRGVDGIAAQLVELTERFQQFDLRSDLILNIKHRS